MKKILLVLFISLCSISLFGQSYSKNGFRVGKPSEWSTVTDYEDIDYYVADHYVAPWGSDSNDGSFHYPWGTLYYAFNQLIAGDTLYVRGGTYYNDPLDDPIVFVNNHDGTEDNYICVFNYPGEKPILDGINATYTGENQLLYLYRCDYWHIRGLYATRVQHGGVAQPYAIEVRGQEGTPATGVIIENCVAYENESNGIYLWYTDSCFVRNCDAYDNYDPVDNNNGNGIVLAYTDAGTTNTVENCRAWNNTGGEGFGGWWTDGIIYYKNCWAWNNSGDPGDGCGFELGYTDEYETINKILTNCISVNNAIGFNQAMADCIIAMYNNIAYSNQTNYVFGGGNPDNANIFYNNIDYDGDNASSFNSTYVHISNDWDTPPGVTTSDADFLSIDTLELEKPRRIIRHPDGSETWELPEIDFLKLAPSSGLIDAGTYVALDYSGLRPDIGYSESDVTGFLPVNNTATADGTTTGIIAWGSQNITVTSASANNICCLPTADATTTGTIIRGQVGANGFELRVAAAQAGTVYLNGVTTNVEAAIPANTSFEVIQVDATHWILKAWSSLGAELTAIVPDAI